MNNFILWQGKHREHKYRIIPDLNWCVYRLQRFDPVRESWREFLGPGSIARQVFDRATAHLIGNEVNREAREDYIAELETKLKAHGLFDEAEAEPACNKPGTCFHEHINDPSPDVAPQIDACEERDPMPQWDESFWMRFEMSRRAKENGR